MTKFDLSGKRAMVLGLESVVGQQLATALAEAGAHLAAIAGKTSAEAALAAKRASRKAAAPGQRSLAQAIDAENEMAVRVMVRQVAKELGGLDVIFFCAQPGASYQRSFELACRYGSRELVRQGEGLLVVLGVDVDMGSIKEQVASSTRVHVLPWTEGSSGAPRTIERALALASEQIGQEERQ
ncbi:MAG TPA: SDR family NAD(P)-dependent oxidoreductase [Dehalococcoidia bacterium]|nr:SDR family NAD(P)-dependent oxidoreductase [Dehalococcoidia bacterium]